VLTVRSVVRSVQAKDTGRAPPKAINVGRKDTIPLGFCTAAAARARARSPPSRLGMQVENGFADMAAWATKSPMRMGAREKSIVIQIGNAWAGFCSNF
jgi:hypothetical protein